MKLSPIVSWFPPKSFYFNICLWVHVSFAAYRRL